MMEAGKVIVNKVLALQAGGPKFDPQKPCKQTNNKQQKTKTATTKTMYAAIRLRTPASSRPVRDEILPENKGGQRLSLCN
jgi:hypothetical protein